MRKINSSIVALYGIISLFAFVILYFILPYDVMLTVALSLALGVSLAGVVRYARDAYYAARSGIVGSDFIIVSLFSVCLATFVQRAWVHIITISNRPDWLVDSAMTIFVPWFVAWAVSLALVAPDIGDSKGIWKSLAIFAAGSMAGFVIAWAFSHNEIAVSSVKVWPHLANRPVCPDHSGVIVSSNGVYHKPDSPYVSMIVPRYCFQDEKEAQSHGYRAPKGLRSDVLDQAPDSEADTINK